MITSTLARSNIEQIAFRDWLCGMNKYMDGEPLAACATEQQRRGYESAGKADAQFSAASLPQHDPANDREWLRGYMGN